MRLDIVPLEQAVGGILVHNISDAEGHKALAKGHQLGGDDIERLRELGKQEVYVALLDPGDVRENDAITRIAAAVAGKNLAASSPNTGRVNLFSSVRGVLYLQQDALSHTNSLEGVAIATIPDYAVVEPKKMVATCKTIGLALPERAVAKVEQIAGECGPLIEVRPLGSAHVAVVLTGSAEARDRVGMTFTEPIERRVRELGGQVVLTEYVAEEPGAIGEAISRSLVVGARCVIIAGETSIMDVDDITPRGIRAAGGTVERYGAPVEPGNLLLLAYCGVVPIIGAPGCVKSRDTNVVDLILPRLLSGERLAQADIVALGTGGLLI